MRVQDLIDLEYFMLAKSGLTQITEHELNRMPVDRVERFFGFALGYQEKEHQAQQQRRQQQQVHRFHQQGLQEPVRVDTPTFEDLAGQRGRNVDVDDWRWD